MGTNVTHNGTSHGYDSCSRDTCGGVRLSRWRLLQWPLLPWCLSHNNEREVNRPRDCSNNSHDINVCDGGTTSKQSLVDMQDGNPRIFSGWKLGLF